MNFNVRRQIDAYLDAVEMTLLKSGAGSRARRIGIVGDLEAHILDSLRERAGDAEATEADVAAVLAALGAPQTYGTGEVQAMEAPARKRRVLPAHVRWGAVLLATGFVGTLILMGSFGGSVNDDSNFFIFMIASTPVVLMLVLSAALGFAGLREIRRDRGRYWGRAPAVLEMAGFPILLLLASPMLFLTVLFTAVLVLVANRVWNLRDAGRKFLVEL